ncbi:hypothetical protein E2986_10614 [Frieseomelitta varia]|uniref:Uncharacterized protein n=1 Tax=Frieseomelitta varia TaxID=561572 RepID=A0A833S2B6_9HYME|nr:hypothetical protein E2986_10614 [Frieseomelitta varia]
MSGVFYYLSTTVNPLLYNIMSNKFREAFKLSNNNKQRLSNNNNLKILEPTTPTSSTKCVEQTEVNFQSMLSNHCGRKWSSRKSVPRQPTYSSLSRYARSTLRQTDDRQNSPSVSVSEDNQKLRMTNTTELNGLNDRKEQDRPGSTTNRREFGRSVSRGSNSSQFTLMSSVSRSFNEGNNNVTATYVQKSPRTVTLGKCNVVHLSFSVLGKHLEHDKGHDVSCNFLLRAEILAERLRLGTKELFSSQQKTAVRATSKPETTTVLPPRFQSHPSIDSANTISNSSLQDYDETEFSGMELARYMGELNCDLIA